MPRRLLAAVVLAAATVTAYAAAPAEVADPTDPARSVGAPGRRDDLEVLRRDYLERSKAFSPDARDRALAFLAALEPRVDALDRAQYLVALLRVAAFADNGHDVLDGGEGAWFPDARLPLRLLWLPDGWVVARAAPEYAALVGARVLTIEGRTPDELLAGLRPLWGGPDSGRRWNLQWVVESAGLLHAAGLAEHPDGLALVVRHRDGVRRAYRIPFVAAADLPPRQALHRTWSPVPGPREAESGWTNAAPAEAVPLYLQQPERTFRALPLPGLDAVYVQFRAHHDDGPQTVADAIRAADAVIDRARPRHLVLDLRFDAGGNIDLTRDWQRSLPARIPGTLYVLVGPYTFSAGIVAAAALRHDGGARTRVVGEPPGDRLTFWSEARPVCLPASRYCMRVNAGLWDLERGCAGRDGCYGDAYGATVGSLQPDLPAPVTIADWLAGRDPGLDAIRRDLAPADPSRRFAKDDGAGRRGPAP